MHGKWVFIGGLGLILMLSAEVLAQLKISGEVHTDSRVRLEDHYRFTWNENRLSLKLESNLSEKARVFGHVWLRNFGFSRAASLSQLGYRDKRYVEPWGIELREAYLDLYGFLFENLDVRIGKQRIAWGTADKINPTDNLNPKDFEDPLDFGRKIPTNAVQLSYYVGDYTLTCVYTPVFTPAVLPPPDWAFGKAMDLPLPPGMQVTGVQDSVTLPRTEARKTSGVGLKLSGSLGGYDVSISYVYGRDDMPLADDIRIIPTGPNTVVVSQHLIYPRMQIAGADMAGQLLGMGVWAEVAAFLPEKVEASFVSPTPEGLKVQQQTVLSRNVYVKYVIGGDYTFRNGLYVNGQFIHGFYGERGRDNLEDYFVLAVQKKFLHDDLKIRLAGALEIKDWQQIDKNYAGILFPEISYYPSDNVELILGAYFIDGKGETMFGNFRKNDELFVKVKVSF